MDEMMRRWVDSISSPPLAAVLCAIIIGLALIAAWAWSKAISCTRKGEARPQDAHAARAIMSAASNASCPTDAIAQYPNGNSRGRG